MDKETLTDAVLGMTREELRAEMATHLDAETSQIIMDLYAKTQQDLHAAMDRNFDLYCTTIAETKEQYNALLHDVGTQTSFMIAQLMRMVYKLRRVGNVSHEELGRYVTLFRRLEEEDFEALRKAQAENVNAIFAGREHTDVPDPEDKGRPYVVGVGRNVMGHKVCIGCGKPPTVINNEIVKGEFFQFMTFDLAGKHVRSGLCEECLKWAEKNAPEAVAEEVEI